MNVLRLPFDLWVADDYGTGIEYAQIRISSEYCCKLVKGMAFDFAAYSDKWLLGYRMDSSGIKPITVGDLRTMPEAQVQ